LFFPGVSCSTTADAMNLSAVSRPHDCTVSSLSLSVLPSPSPSRACLSRYQSDAPARPGTLFSEIDRINTHISRLRNQQLLDEALLPRLQQFWLAHPKCVPTSIL
ncbi:unnamed protein product, partial [Polarella glacialis]